MTRIAFVVAALLVALLAFLAQRFEPGGVAPPAEAQPNPAGTRLAAPASADRLESGPSVAESASVQASAAPSAVSSRPATEQPEVRESYDPTLDSFEVLSSQWVETYFSWCLPHLRPQCASAMELAQAVVSEEKDEADSWSYRVEYELQGFVDTARDRYGVENAKTVCNHRGCLLYLAGTIPRFEFDPFARELRAQPWMSEFAWVTDPLRGTLPRRFYLTQKWHDYWKTPGDIGILLVFKRETGKSG